MFLTFNNSTQATEFQSMLFKLGIGSPDSSKEARKIESPTKDEFVVKLTEVEYETIVANKAFGAMMSASENQMKV